MTAQEGRKDRSAPAHTASSSLSSVHVGRVPSLGSALLPSLPLLLLWADPSHAYPSKALDIPNGERVPCRDGDAGCIDRKCRGLGHGSCAGGYVSPDLNPFGADLRASNFTWTTELCGADSDGDGFTNGEELGDPCCVWTKGAAEATYTASFVPSHPGYAGAAPPADYARPACGTDDTTPPTRAELFPTETAAFNPGERQGSFEFRIKDYPIPKRRTTYVDFLFNLPDDLPGEIVHVIYGEAIVSQPRHLHHFVVTGCRSKVDESIVGLPMDDSVPDDCNVPVGGFSGWAPGVTMWDLPTNAGVAVGPGFGIRAFQLNVHYTDGDDPYLNGEHAIGTDGIKVYYTPDLRPKTMVSSPLIQVGIGPATMYVEPNKKRAFMTRTCTVQSRCMDRDDKTMNFIGSQALNDPELTCESGAAKFFCMSDLFQVACPQSCGLCEEGSPRDPDEWTATSMYYHGHLLGREMYTTLTPRDSDSKIDLHSRDIWFYDDQPLFPLHQGTQQIRSGDKIQTTCVFDSTSRTENTRFDLETYDEMCITTLMVVFDTPEIIDDGITTAANEVYLRAFQCESGTEASDIWMGELGLDEDARDIAFLHPLENATCSFPTGLWIYDGIPTFEMRCNGEIVDDESGGGICATLPAMILDPDAPAGINCEGGTHDQKDSNDGTTKEQCTEGGGSWNPYTCGEAEMFLLQSSDVTSEIKQYLREYWWQPKCCVISAGYDEEGEDYSSSQDEADEGEGDGPSSQEESDEGEGEGDGLASPDGADEGKGDGLGSQDGESPSTPEEMASTSSAVQSKATGGASLFGMILVVTVAAS